MASGKDITVLDNSLDKNLLMKLNPLNAIFTGVWWPILVGSVEEMVNKVLSAAGSEQIVSLLISGHGGPGMQAVGCGSAIDDDDGRKSLQFDVGTNGAELRGHASKHLSRLRGKFTSDAVVTLGGCNVAQGEDGKKLLSLLSKELNAFVQAGDALQRIVVPGFEGNVVRCYRDTCWVASAAL